MFVFSSVDELHRFNKKHKKVVEHEKKEENTEVVANDEDSSDDAIHVETVEPVKEVDVIESSADETEAPKKRTRKKRKTEEEA